MGIYREEDVEQLVARSRNSARDNAKAMVQVRGLKVASFGTLSLFSAVGGTESGTRAAAERDGERGDRSERKIGEERREGIRG